MNKATCITVILLLCASIGHAISLTEYTIPTSKTQEAYLNGAYNMAGSSKDSSQTGYNLGGGANYNFYYRSLPFSFSMLTNGNVTLQRGSIKGDKEQSSYDVALDMRANKYFSENSKFFGFGSEKTRVAKPSSRSHTYHTEVEVSGGLGYGRSVDATPLKKAIRIAEEFERFGVTTGIVTEDALLKLARIIDNEQEYKTTYGSVEYSKYWYNAMEDVLRETGVLEGGRLGAIGILRIQEVLKETTALRFYGWEVRSGVGLQLSDRSGNRSDPLFTIAYDWARPVGIALQFTNELSSSIYKKKVGTSPTDTSFTFTEIMNRFDFNYELSNRIHWSNSATLHGTFTAKEMQKYTLPQAVFDVRTSSDFWFYLENELDFKMGFYVSRNDDNISTPVTDWGFTSGIYYRLR